ncbi:hypothetical protein Q1695_012044 [Nippostrongylus brasiliensis]|nr:hypothetical protein Q1695_012044 [Nippostrongylus brasiliensis]
METNSGRSADPDRCSDQMATVELFGGAQRTCLPNTKSCSIGFSCQPSVRNRWLCCSVGLARAQFTCPFEGQRPVLTAQGGNQFCSRVGQNADCPQNSLCVAASGSGQPFICCSSSASQVNPSCPNNGIPQTSATGYKACSPTSVGDCSAGYSCVRATNDFSIYLCCSSSAAQQPICPRQGTLLTERGRPVYCSASQPQLCPSDYSCEAALGTPATYVCCSSSSSPALSCPARYVANLDPNGNQIFCSRSSTVDCPGGSVCLASVQSSSVSLCCRDDSSPRVCPNNQNAYITPDGNVETCNAPGVPCSQPGYICQLSIPLAQYVCCGNVSDNVSYCADGRKTYEQTAGKTYTCNPLQVPSACPIGYDCAQSTTAGVSVCCASNDVPPTQEPSDSQCPIGWSAYRNDIDHKTRSCQGPFDMGCPIGFSCTQSALAGQFLCCRLSTSMRCVKGQTFLSNNHPRLCSRNRLNQCPRGYSCEQSTNPTITVCCGSAVTEQPMCPSGRPPAMLNGFVRSCPIEGQTSGCPNGNICQRATNELLVCCPFMSISRHKSKENSISMCPDDREPIYSHLTEEVTYCDVTAYMCPNGQACLPKLGSDRFLCCSNIPQCSSGTAEKDFSGKMTRCTSTDDCGRGYLCSPSDVNGVQLCCSSGVRSMKDMAPPHKTNVADGEEDEWVVIEG